MTIKARHPSVLIRSNSEDCSSGDSCVTRKGRRSPSGGTPRSRRAVFSKDEAMEEDEDHTAACLIDDEAAAQMLLILLEAN